MQISAGLLAEAAERSLAVSPQGKSGALDSLGVLATPTSRSAVLVH